MLVCGTNRGNNAKGTFPETGKKVVVEKSAVSTRIMNMNLVANLTISCICFGCC
jgi:hypothetical protein